MRGVSIKPHLNPCTGLEKVAIGICPICKTSADLEQPPGGDYRRVECRKCGKFQITGTALAMLASRLSSVDKKTVARLSHATSRIAIQFTGDCRGGASEATSHLP